MRFEPLKRHQPDHARLPLHTAAEMAAIIGIDARRMQSIISGAAKAGNGPPQVVNWKTAMARGQGKVSRYHKAPFLAWWSAWLESHPDATS